MKIFSIFCILLFVFSSVAVFFNLNRISDTIFQIKYDKNTINKEEKDPNIIDAPKLAAEEPYGKPLQVHQYANISKTYDEITYPVNIDFDLAPHWTSKNVSINYEGVAKKKDWVTNGEFDSDISGWTYESLGSAWSLDGYDGGLGNPAGSVQFRVAGGLSAGDYAYYEQNITIPDGMGSGTARLSLDYRMVWTSTFNGSVFISLIIGDVEKNKTVHVEEAPLQSWESLILTYDPASYGQILPGVATLRFGVHVWGDDSVSPWNEFNFDNIICELWTNPNTSGIIKVNDNEFNQNYTYITTNFGEGYSFIDVERYREVSDAITFTVFQNITEVLDFRIANITIQSFALKSFSSEFFGNPRSRIEYGLDITWHTDVPISTIPVEYTSWLEVKKPNDWIFTEILDGYEAEQLNNCSGTYLGSTKLIIPNIILSPGTWSLEAISRNYISNSALKVWNNTGFVSLSRITFGDLFLINVTINETVSLLNTRLNCSIYYSNGSLFWQDSLEPATYEVLFGNFTVEDNMTVGRYIAKLEWMNHQNFSYVDQVGFNELEFMVWHHTSLTAVKSSFEIITGAPLLAKVKFTDIDINISIAFSTIMYNTTFGQSGTMLYQGSGIYLADIDTSSLGIGDYYISFSTTSDFYENLSINDLIDLSVVSQELALDVPHSVIQAMANSYAICQINVTGAISGALIWPANISTNWENPYNVINHNNGTFTLNFSTVNLPTQGIIETFAVSIYANKTDYGETSGFITITIYPIDTVINANSTYIIAEINEIVYVKINYTIESSGLMISDVNYSITWGSSFNVIPNAQGIILQLNTLNLSIDTYTAIIKAEKVGYETAFKTITVVIDYVEFGVDTVNFENSLDTHTGERSQIIIKLTNPDTNDTIDNASIFYSWEFGLGYFEPKSNGIYELELQIPQNYEGNYKMTLIISKKDSIFKATEFSFIIGIDAPTQSNRWIMYILFGLMGIISVLGVVILRVYVFKPIKKKKLDALLAKTQRYKDTMNIEAIVISNRESGLHLYSKSYYLLRDHQEELLSGFIQAITLISSEIIGREKIEQITIKSDKIKGAEKIIELDFKHFNFFISDYKDFRVVFILKEKASERFKNKIAEFLSNLDVKIPDKLKKWDGDLIKFHMHLPSLIDEHFQLYFREEFKLNPVIDIDQVSKEGEYTKMVKRLLNVILSMTKDHENFYLEDAVGTVHEKNQDKIIEALEILLQKQVIISSVKD